MQRTDASEEKHQLGDYQLIQYQFLGPIIVRINDIVKHLSSFVGKHCFVFMSISVFKLPLAGWRYSSTDQHDL